MFFSKKKNGAPLVQVEISIIALIKDQYVNKIFTISAPQGTTIKNLLKKASSENLIDNTIFKFIKKFSPPISLIINGTHVTRKQTAKHTVENGDRITIFTPLSGG